MDGLLAGQQGWTPGFFNSWNIVLPEGAVETSSGGGIVNRHVTTDPAAPYTLTFTMKYTDGGDFGQNFQIVLGTINTAGINAIFSLGDGAANQLGTLIFNDNNGNGYVLGPLAFTPNAFHTIVVNFDGTDIEVTIDAFEVLAASPWAPLADTSDIEMQAISPTGVDLITIGMLSWVN